MALKKWRGGAAAIAQVTRITFSAYTSGQTYTCTINGKSISYTAGASTLADVAAGLVAAWLASTYPEFVEVTPSSSSGLLLTGVYAGEPFEVSATATGGITSTVASVTACTGPNWFTDPVNWEGGVAPAATDDLLFADSTFSCLYGIVDVVNNYGDITIDSTYAGAAIGLPINHTRGYREYRPRFLKLGDGSSAFAVTIGLGTGRQPSRVLIDANGADVALAIYGSVNTSGDDEPIMLHNPGALSEVDVYSGTLRVDADTSGELAELRITPGSQSQNSIKVVVTERVDAGVIVQSGGTLEVRGDSTSYNGSAQAIVDFVLASTCPTITVATGAEARWRSSAGITTKLNVYSEGKITFAGSGAAKTVTAADIYNRGSIDDPLGIVTWTAGIALKGCSLSECTINLGRNRTINV